MPIIDETDEFAGPLEAPITPVVATPHAERGVWRAAFETENDMVALFDIIDSQGFIADPDFDLWDAVQKDEFVKNYADQFFGVTSAPEFAHLKTKLQTKVIARETLAKSGFSGVAASMVAAITSPTILIPGGQIRTGLRAGQAAVQVGIRSAAAGAAAVAIQESALQAAPNDRSLVESVANVGIGTLAAGVFGAGIGAAFGRRAGRIIDEAEVERPVIPDDAEVYVADEAPSASPDVDDAPINPTGEAEAVEAARGNVRLDSTLGLANTIGKMSPTVRGYTSPYNTVRDVMRRLDSGGLLFKNEEGFVADTDVFTRAKTWEGQYYRARQGSNSAIRDYYRARRPTSERLSRSEIMSRAADAIEQGIDEYQGPDIVKQVARSYQDNVFKPFADEARRLEFNGHEHWRNPETYVPHMVKRTLAARDRDGFVGVLAEHFGEVLTTRASKSLDALAERTARREELAEDLIRPPEEIEALRNELLRSEQEIAEGLKAPSQRKIDRAAALREDAKGKTGEEAKALRDRAKELETSNKELRARHTELQGINRRRRNLNKSRATLEDRRQVKVEAIRKAESDNLKTINTLTARAQKFLERAPTTGKALNEFQEQVATLTARLDKFAGDHPDYAAIIRDADGRVGNVATSELIAKFKDARPSRLFRNPSQLRRERGAVKAQITRTQGQIAKADRVTRTNLLSRVEDLQVQERQLDTELNTLTKDMEELEANLTDANVPAGRGQTAGIVRAMLLDLNEARQKTIQRRAYRIQRLSEQRDAIDPGIAVRAADEVRTKINADAAAVRARLESYGVQLGEGEFDVGASAQKHAEVIAGKMLGEGGRVPLISTILERGPELERTLNIDPLKVWSNGHRFADFMERDLDYLSRAYTRTVGSDFEVFREFGSLTPFGNSRDGIPSSQIARELLREVEEARTAAREKYTGAKLDAEFDKIAKAQQTAERDIQAIVDRIRHRRGIPADPSAVAYRMGRTLINLNTLRLMGGVMIASIADPARLIIKQGVKRTYGTALDALFRNLPAIQATRREVQYAAAGLDMVTHGRLREMTDVFDDFAPGTQIERGLQFATNQMGRVALFDVWNAFWKQSAGTITTMRLMHDIETIVRAGADDASRPVREAERFLAHSGLSDEMADRIWIQMTETPGGADTYKGVLVPNTSEWTDPDAVLALRSAILRQVDDTIVTPGTERPLMMDANMWARLLFQFRSFTFASLNKTLLFGAQELKHGNMNVVLGGAMSLGLGALSWWTWANLAGGHALEAMQQADSGKWLDEAINRSGLLGPVQEALNVGSKIPWLADYTTFSGQATTRSYSPYRDPFIDALGPSVGLVKDLQTIAGTLDDPGENTLKAARRLMPFQNLFYLRRALTEGVEEASGGL